MTDAAAAASNESRLGAAARRVGVAVLVLASLWGLWEGYKWLWETTGWTWPFAVDDGTMPHLHDVFAAFSQPTTTGGPPLIRALLHATWFTGKEALAGFLLGAAIGFVLGGRALAVAAARTRDPAVHRRVADRADPRGRADGRRRPRLEGRAGLEGGCDPRGIPHVLPGRDQHACAAFTPSIRAPSS